MQKEKKKRVSKLLREDVLLVLWLLFIVAASATLRLPIKQFEKRWFEIHEEHYMWWFQVQITEILENVFEKRSYTSSWTRLCVIVVILRKYF